MHTTNYYNSFISVAEDCPVKEAEVPKQKGESKSVAQMQLEILVENPYEFDSDEILFRIHAIRNQIPQTTEEKEKFFSKGQACFRASPLAKRYGFGFHFNEKAKVALYGMESDEYQKLSSDANLKQLKGMRSKKA